MARGDDPHKVVQKVGENANKIELSDDMKLSATFNVADVTPYIKDEAENDEDLSANPP